MAAISRLFGRNGEILYHRQYQLLILANVNAAIGLQLLSPILVTLTNPFNISKVEAGLMITVFSAPGIVVFPLVGILTDHYGRKPILVISLFLFGISGATIALTTSYPIVLTLRAVQGIGFAGIYPVIISSIGDIYSRAQETTAQGLRFTSTGIVQAIAPLAAGGLVAISWRFPFLFYSFAIPVAVIILILFDEPKNNSGENNVSIGKSLYRKELIWLITRRDIIAAVAALSVPMFVFTGFLTYNSFIIVQAYNGTPEQAGALITVMSITLAGTASQAGRIISLFPSRFILLLVANICMSLGLIGFALASTFILSIPGLLVMGAGIGIIFTLLRSVITNIAPKKYRGGLVGIGEASLRLASAATPVILGVIITFIQPEFNSTSSIRWTLIGLGGVSGILGTIFIYLSPTTLEERTIDI